MCVGEDNRACRLDICINVRDLKLNTCLISGLGVMMKASSQLVVHQTSCHFFNFFFYNFFNFLSRSSCHVEDVHNILEQ
jgi:hypothetical protein